MRSERLEFSNAKGEKLSAVLDLTLGEPTAYALFAHCFTCGKDNLAAKRIAERLSVNLDAATRKRLLEIADKCPVHRRLSSEINIRTFERPAERV